MKRGHVAATGAVVVINIHNENENEQVQRRKDAREVGGGVWQRAKSF